MAKKTKAEQWGENPLNLSGSVNQLRKELKSIRSATLRRISALKRLDAFSYAANSLERTLSETYLYGKLPDVNRMKFQQVEKELAIYHKFWGSTTSTVKGSREEQIKQSIRFFGTDAKGRPNRILTIEEGRQLWAALDRFKELFKETTQYDSRRIQRLMGEHIEQVLDDDLDWTSFLGKFYEEVREDYNHTQFNDVPINWNKVYEE